MPIRAHDLLTFVHSCLAGSTTADANDRCQRCECKSIFLINVYAVIELIVIVFIVIIIY